MMGGVSPETRWASYKYGIIKFLYVVASCWIFLYELYYDARIHKHQIKILLGDWVDSNDELLFNIFIYIRRLICANCQIVEYNVLIYEMCAVTRNK